MVDLVGEPKHGVCRLAPGVVEVPVDVLVQVSWCLVVGAIFFLSRLRRSVCAPSTTQTPLSVELAADDEVGYEDVADGDRPYSDLIRGIA